MAQNITENNKREFRSLEDILDYKEEPAPQNKAQKIARMLSLGTGVFDGVLLGWKLYRKYQEGAFLFGNKKRR